VSVEVQIKTTSVQHCNALVTDVFFLDGLGTSYHCQQLARNIMLIALCVHSMQPARWVQPHCAVPLVSHMWLAAVTVEICCPSYTAAV
jgi:hypothetical protein